ncbi:MAG TPA: GntR family transcriptional regulator [Firmicutes bacterium]|nr:GntR family transcriptional regulator [Candidatus Fermentithermobacillaceae bacterium]
MKLGESKNPLYCQVKEDILRKIRSGELKPGDLLPSEDELTRIYNVSRITVKRALQELAMEGELTRRQGKGTFVTVPKLEEDISKAVALAHPVLMHGEKSWHKVLSVDMVLPEPEVARFLQIGPTARAVRIERLKLVDNEPVGYERSYIPDEICPGLQEKLKNSSANLIYEILQSDYSLVLTRVRMFIEPTILNPTEAKLLQSRVGMPAMLWQRITYSTGDRPVEFLREVVRGDRFKYYLEYPTKLP